MRSKKGVCKACQRFYFGDIKILSFYGNQIPRISRIDSFLIFFTGMNFREIIQNLQNSQNLIPAKLSSLKVIKSK